MSAPNYRLLSIVILAHPLLTGGGRALPEGARGVVVHAYHDGAAYEVEFAEPFPCVVTVRPDDIQ